MAVPKRRTSHARQGNRRSHHRKKPVQFAFCQRCGEAIRSHVACWHCGWSNVQGREVEKVETGDEE